MSFPHGCKTPQINDFLFMGNLRLPWFFGHPFLKGNPFKAMLIACFTVGSILPITAFSQIFKSIIRFISVNMINLIFWPFFGHVKPRQSVRCIIFSINFYMNIATFMKTSGLLPNTHFGAWLYPYKSSSFWGIIQNGFKLSVSDHAWDITRNDLGFQPC